MIYTYWGNLDEKNNGTSVLEVSSGFIPVGKSGDFTIAEYQALSTQYDLRAGAIPWTRTDFPWPQQGGGTPSPPRNQYALVGNDGYLGTPGQGGTPLSPSIVAGAPPAPTWQLVAWTQAQSFRIATATRDSNGVITTASVAWPDGATGTFTTDTASSSWPGAIDAYHITYIYNPGGGNVTKTITQTAVTRDSNGAVTVQPALTVA